METLENNEKRKLFFYDKPTRRRLKAKIREYHREGLGYLEMLPFLKSDGFKRPDGTELTASTISAIGQKQCGIKMRGGRKRTKTKRRTTVVHSHDTDPIKPTRKSAADDIFVQVLDSDMDEPTRLESYEHYGRSRNE